LCIAAQLITISALESADPLVVTWASVLLATAPAPLVAITAFTPVRDPLAAQSLERRRGTANLFLLEGRARLTPAFISYARIQRSLAGAEPKLTLAIAGWARTHPVVVIPTSSHVIDLGASPRYDCPQSATGMPPLAAQKR
jgi:hypothetical protein